MRTVYVQELMRLPLGKQGENGAARIVWQGLAARYQALYGSGAFTLTAKRCGDAAAYPVAVSTEGGDVVWLVRAADVASPGSGSCELTYTVDGAVAKSQTWSTYVAASISGDAPGEPPEEPAKAWFAAIQAQIGNLDDLTTKAGASLVAAVNEAAKTGSGGAGSISMRTADGYIQYSTDGGDTWANLIALAELKGAPGQDGAPGKDGTNGTDGHTPEITATKSGKTTTIKADGTAIAEIQDGADGKDGAPGADGAGMDITGATVGQIAKISAVDASGKPTAWEPVDMATGGNGHVFGTYDYTVLASGTIPAGTVTAEGLGKSYFDTGVTVGDLRKYRVWGCYYRCDAADQYYGFMLSSDWPNRRILYSTNNAMQIVAIWADDDGQVVIPLGAGGNVYCTDPLDAEEIGGLTRLPLISGGGGTGIASFGTFHGAADSDHIYVGVFHLNSKETNSKDMRWAITGVVKK